MRRWSVILLSASLFWMSSVYAQNASLLGCLDCFNFVAPSVSSAESISPPEVGLIVYDSTRQSFRGFNDSGRWLKMSNEKELRTVTATGSIFSTDDVILANTDSGSITLNLPVASSLPGKEFFIKKTDGSPNSVTIDPNLSEMIDGDLTRFLNTRNEVIRILSNGANWIVMDRTLRAPTIQKLISGSGTYMRPNGVAYLRIRMVGGGGGGGGSGTGTSGGAGQSGLGTTFGASLLSAGGGSGAMNANSGLGGGGGAPSVLSPAIQVVALVGGAGGTGGVATASTALIPGGIGGASSFGGAGTGTIGSNKGGNAVANSGGGGGGAGMLLSSNYATGSGGGAGAYVEAILSDPSPSYSYGVGDGGHGGVGGTSGMVGGDGGSGFIEVTEYYR